MANSVPVPQAIIIGGMENLGGYLGKMAAQKTDTLTLIGPEEHTLQALKGEIDSKHPTMVRIIPENLSHPGAADDIYTGFQLSSLFPSLPKPVGPLVNILSFRPTDSSDPWESDGPEPAYAPFTLEPLTHSFARDMMAYKNGHIINILFHPPQVPMDIPEMFEGLRDFLIEFGHSLEEEYGEQGLKVTTLCLSGDSFYIHSSGPPPFLPANLNPYTMQEKDLAALILDLILRG